MTADLGRVRVMIATTQMPVVVQSLLEEPALGRSLMCINQTAQIAEVSKAYQDFVALGTGVIEKLYGHKAFRLDVSEKIDVGQSWQLGVFSAHALHAENRLAQMDDEASTYLWATGEVSPTTLTVRSIADLAKKLELSLDFFAAQKGKARVVAAWPKANAGEVNEALRAQLAERGVTVLELEGPGALLDAVGLRNPQLKVETPKKEATEPKKDSPRVAISRLPRAPEVGWRVRAQLKDAGASLSRRKVAVMPLLTSGASRVSATAGGRQKHLVGAVALALAAILAFLFRAKLANVTLAALIGCTTVLKDSWICRRIDGPIPTICKAGQQRTAAGLCVDPPPIAPPLHPPADTPPQPPENNYDDCLASGREWDWAKDTCGAKAVRSQTECVAQGRTWNQAQQLCERKAAEAPPAGPAVPELPMTDVQLPDRNTTVRLALPQGYCALSRSNATELKIYAPYDQAVGKVGRVMLVAVPCAEVPSEEARRNTRAAVVWVRMLSYDQPVREEGANLQSQQLALIAARFQPVDWAQDGTQFNNNRAPSDLGFSLEGTLRLDSEPEALHLGRKENVVSGSQHLTLGVAVSKLFVANELFTLRIERRYANIATFRELLEQAKTITAATLASGR